MNRFPAWVSTFALALFLTGCDAGTGLTSFSAESEAPTPTKSVVEATSSSKDAVGANLSSEDIGVQECASSPDFVVSNLTDLRAATRDAKPGDVIAIDGMITVRTREVTLKSTGGITLTCATSGSGLRAASDFERGTLLAPYQKNLTLSNLVLDTRSADNPIAHVIFALNQEDNPRAVAEGLRIANNRFRCSSLSCVALQGVDNASIIGNEMRARSAQNAVRFFPRPVNPKPEGLVVSKNSLRCEGYACVRIAATAPGGYEVKNNQVECTESTFCVLVGPNATGRIASNGIDMNGKRHAITVFSRDQERGSTITKNDLYCSGESTACIFSNAFARLAVTSNHIEVKSSGLVGGILLQSLPTQLFPNSPGNTIDDSRIENNVLVSSRLSENVSRPAAPWAIGLFYQGENVAVHGNETRGDWGRGLTAVNINQSTFEQNSIENPSEVGFRLSSHPKLSPLRGTQLRKNRVTDPGTGGIVVSKACDNGFVGNRVPSDPGGVPGVVFTENTGDNTWIGSGASGVDRGKFDCDGDGRVDPNQVTGLSPPREGIDFGDIQPDSSPSTSETSSAKTIHLP